ncbi:hypothetical protein D3C71_2073700 [compost metagenome]
MVFCIHYRGYSYRLDLVSAPDYPLGQKASAHSPRISSRRRRGEFYRPGIVRGSGGFPAIPLPIRVVRQTCGLYLRHF